MGILARPVANFFSTMGRTSAFSFKKKKLPIWGTKGFEFWTFLSLLLLKSKPRSILELGSGRSTITLGEYAKYSGAEFVSLETNKWWFDKSRMEMRAAGLPDGAVHHVAIDGTTGWYEAKPFDSVVLQRAPYDFVLFDAPNREDGDSRGMRDAPAALENLRTCATGAVTIVVDDVHRRHVMNSVDLILDPVSDYEKYFYDYRVVPAYLNTLCICVRKGTEAQAAMPLVADMLGMNVYSDFSTERCVQD